MNITGISFRVHVLELIRGMICKACIFLDFNKALDIEPCVKNRSN